MVEHILLMVECVFVLCTTFALVIKTNSIMKEIKNVEKGENFTTVNVGKLNEIKEYELAMGNFSIPGKMFAGHALQATGAELSFQSLAAGQDYGTRHTHKTHEELYFILKGEGIFDVDGKRFPVSEGSIVRIAPNGKRAFKNTGSSEMLVLCVQYKANSFSDVDEPLKDGIMLEANVKL